MRRAQALQVRDWQGLGRLSQMVAAQPVRQVPPASGWRAAGLERVADGPMQSQQDGCLLAVSARGRVATVSLLAMGCLHSLKARCLQGLAGRMAALKPREHQYRPVLAHARAAMLMGWAGGSR